MTTESTRAHIERALSIVARERPDIEIERTRGHTIGRQRVMQVWLKSGEYAQLPFPRLGVHGGEVARVLAQGIMGLKKKSL